MVEGTAERALREWYDEHVVALLSFVLPLVSGDRQHAEDVVQETLVRAWQHRDSLDTRAGSLRPWLFTVARRITVDLHRRRGARPFEVRGSAGEWALMSAADAAEVENGLDRIVLLDALAALSAEHREMIVQTYYLGRTVAEAARILELPIGTAKSRAYYALRALRLALTERGVIE